MSTLILHLSFALGGGFGAVARHLVTLRFTHRFPLSTLLVNVFGCFLLGLGSVLLADIPGFVGEEERRLAFGFCGGFTTFSSFAYQSIDLHRSYSLIHAVVNVLMNVLFCLAAFWLGRFSVL